MKRIVKLVYILKNYLKYTLNSRPKVYWCLIYNADDPYSLVSKNNFGDMLSPYIVEKLTGKRPIYFDPYKVIGGKYIEYTCMVGSILQFSGQNSVVWGSGVLSKDVDVKCKSVLAVRGECTARVLENLGYDKVDVFGDPALLLPLLYSPKISKKYKIGIIPNFIEYNEIHEYFTNYTDYESLSKDVIVIDLMTQNIEEVIDLILSCEKVIATSLHGIIVANAYGIPTIWAKYSDKLDGDDIKFYDYFSSVQLTDIKFMNLDFENLLCIDEANYFLPDLLKIKKVQSDLINTFPYKIQKEGGCYFENR